MKGAHMEFLLVVLGALVAVGFLLRFLVVLGLYLDSVHRL
jgi:hypothetical protein